MFWRKEFLLLVLAVSQVVSRNANYCYATNKNPYVKFGTRTAYSFVHGGRTPREIVPNCRPVQIWMMIRHGTRYISQRTQVEVSQLSKLRDAIIHNHKVEGHGQLCDTDLRNLEDWNLDHLTQHKNGKLSEQGVEDMNNLGKRIRSNFPELFPTVKNDVCSGNYMFRTTIGERVTSSCREFMLGLVDQVDIPPIGPPATDPLFAAFNRCPRWVTEVANNPKNTIEISRFMEGADYMKLVSGISRRLGFSYTISKRWVLHIWNMCRNEMAWRINEVSPWCAVFSDEDFRILEFLEDLIDYYKRGYGHEFNIRLGCPLMRDLFWHFERLESDDYSKEPKGIFNIGRSGSLHSLLAAMGVANDSTPLLASDFRSGREYKWRTSEIGPFAANLAAVFYKCNGTLSRNKVKFYLSEKPVLYEGCQSGLCDWEYLKNKFGNASFDCNTGFCYPNTAILFVDVATVIVLLAISTITIFVCRRWMHRQSFHPSVRLWRKLRQDFRTPIQNV